jgi:hypothetical protein
MRAAASPVLLALALPLSLAAACADDPGASTGETFAIDTPSFTLQPGEEKFYCYYTTLPNTAPSGIRRVASRMPPGSHHMIVFKTRSPLAPDDTLAECTNFGMGDGVGGIPVWLYASQLPEDEVMMPDDVGIAVAPGQPVFVNMHYINTTDAPLTANVHVDLETFAAERSFTEAHTYVTFNTEIDVAPGATGSAGGSCEVPTDAQFLMMSTHSHKYTTSVQVHDGAAMVIETRDWEHATVQQWGAPYYKFSSGKLDYRCDYHNTSNQRLRTGESALANEMCMAVGVIFPATGDTYCLNSITFTL